MLLSPLGTLFNMSGVVCFDEADARPFWAADMDESGDAHIKDRASQHAHF